MQNNNRILILAQTLLVIFAVACTLATVYVRENADAAVCADGRNVRQNITLYDLARRIEGEKAEQNASIKGSAELKAKENCDSE